MENATLAVWCSINYYYDNYYKSTGHPSWGNKQGPPNARQANVTSVSKEETLSAKAWTHTHCLTGKVRTHTLPHWHGLDMCTASLTRPGHTHCLTDKAGTHTMPHWQGLDTLTASLVKFRYTHCLAKTCHFSLVTIPNSSFITNLFLTKFIKFELCKLLGFFYIVLWPHWPMNLAVSLGASFLRHISFSVTVLAFLPIAFSLLHTSSESSDRNFSASESCKWRTKMP